jgi:hypothetical protein
MPAKAQYTEIQVEGAYEILQKATKARPVTSEELGERLRIDDVEGNPIGRGLITEVIRRKRIPIVAKGKGYFVPESYDDVKSYLNDLNRRSLGILERGALVDLLWHETHGDTEGQNAPSLDEV